MSFFKGKRGTISPNAYIITHPKKYNLEWRLCPLWPPFLLLVSTKFHLMAGVLQNKSGLPACILTLPFYVITGLQHRKTINML